MDTKMNGVIYVAFGPAAKREVKASIASLWQYEDLPVAVVTDEDLGIPGIQYIPFENPGKGARWAKLNIDVLAPWDNVVYLDADTRVRGDISVPFLMLEDNWDMVIAPSQNQGADVFAHIQGDEKRQTLEELNNPFPLQLQAGVMYFNKERCHPLFEAWRGEWLRWKDQDQAALLRALEYAKIRIMILSRNWNGGNRIEHRFGHAV